MRYFAYGSNMCTNRLHIRKVRSAAFVSIGKLPCHALRFHKRSQDDSGKCNAYKTGNKADEVTGVVFDIDPAEKRYLDEAEGLGQGYNQITAEVFVNGAPVKAYMYIADPRYIDNTLKPYTWYRDIVVAGARQHVLPEAYIKIVEDIRCLSDADKEREAQERRCLPCS